MVMRKIAFAAASVLMTAVLNTSCDNNDSGAQSPLPAEQTFTDSSGLRLSYSGSPMLGNLPDTIPD